MSIIHLLNGGIYEADLLLYVLDINNPKKEDHIETVDKILKEIKADDKDVILVFNKCDTFYSLMDKFQKKEIKNTLVGECEAGVIN
ncbi:MAG: hypothetical protein FWG98_12295 [Candidatus Cloacimonetes bacterium]|nr:hypothetical protein [Candidatus Cloacimonadota bacterium]